MVFNLYFSNELTSSYSLNNKYKIYKYSIKKNNDCNIETSFDVDFKNQRITRKHTANLHINDHNYPDHQTFSILKCHKC